MEAGEMNQVETSQKETFQDKLSELVSLAVYFEVVGIVYSIVFYGHFGLNYADFADVSDLLVGAFKEPAVFIGALVVVLAAIVPKRGRRGVRQATLFSLVPILFAWGMATVAYYYVSTSERAMPMSNTGTNVRVYLPAATKFYENDQKLDSVRFLGKVGGYFFFFDTLSKREGEPTVEKEYRSVIVLPEKHVVQVARERRLNE